MTLTKIRINSLTKNHKFGGLINLKIQKKSPLISPVFYLFYSATQYPVVTDVA